MSDVCMPCWVLPGGRIDEGLCAQEYLSLHNMICVNGVFFTPEGAVRDESALRKEIYDMIYAFVSTGVVKKVSSILEVMRLEARRDRLPSSENRIHVANGTYHLRDGFVPDREICRYRLPVVYNPDAPEPVRWLEFLQELLEPEDIDTLQEYLGYCLIPVTRGQKMLTLVGSGGEGKSRIGVVMKAILGDNMSTGSLSKVEMNRFARADLEHLLLFVDDDLKMEALTKTNYIKAIITADTPMDLERKGKQSYQGIVHARFLAFGNASLQALHDRSHGFFRRQIILRVKARPENRVDDPYLGDCLVQERDSIFLWALTGLYRLIANNYRFTISRKAQENLSAAMEDSNNIRAFLESNGYIRFDEFGSCTSRALYGCYTQWCEDNASPALGARTFWNYLNEHAKKLGLTYSNNIDIGGGKTARGFRGIRLCR